MSEAAAVSAILKPGEIPASVLEHLRRHIHRPGVMTPMEKGAYIRKNFPEMAAQTLRLADEAMRGMLVLPGTGPELHFVGSPPLWQDNPPDDSEYTFHLNRMHHWKTLAEAYTLTGDVRYAEKVVAEWLDWIDTNPCPALRGPDGAYQLSRFEKRSTWRALEVGIRGYRTWPLVLELLLDSGCITPAFLSRLLACVQLHCRVLYEISPRLWPKADHNHYLMENLGLLTFACQFPELADSEQYREAAQRGLDRCIDVQCTPCGAQIEGCPSYHNGCVLWFALRIVLADQYGLQVPQEYCQKVRGMLRHSIEATRSCGGNFPWGDSHSSEKETMALAAVACYMAFGDWRDLARARWFYPHSTLVTELRDHLWRLRSLERLGGDLARADAEPLRPDAPCFVWQKDVGQVYLRSGWDKESLSVMTGCRTPVQNKHAHIDAGGFDFTACGQPLVTDPGIYTYAEGEARHHFKGSLWHNCLTVDGKDMWEYRGSWNYGPQKPGAIVWAQSGPGLAYAVSRHSNYEPVTATRVLALVQDSWLLVLDKAQGLAAGQRVEVGFHLDRTEVLSERDGVLTQRAGAPNVRLVGDGGQDDIALEEAAISTANDVAHPSRIARWRKTMRCAGDYMQAVLLVPFAAGAPVPDVQKPVLTHSADGAVHILLTVGAKTVRLRLQSDRLTQE